MDGIVKDSICIGGIVCDRLCKRFNVCSQGYNSNGQYVNNLLGEPGGGTMDCREYW